MKVFLLFTLLSLCTAFNIHDCYDDDISDMKLKLCSGLKQYERVDFHDFTGENEIRLKQDKLYRNHGEIVALFKDTTLYVGKEKYDLKKWEKLKNNLK